MALQKSITFPNGNSGSYLKIGFSRVDDLARDASFHFHLYKDRATRQACPKIPVQARVAKLRLTGDKYDQYLSGTALAAKPGATHTSQAYMAAKTEPLICDIDLKDATPVLEAGQTGS